MATDWRMICLEQDGPLAIVTLTNPPLHVLEDVREGVDAFINKRMLNFRHR